MRLIRRGALTYCVRACILWRTTQCLTHSVPRIQLKELAENLLLFIGQTIIAVLMPFVYQAKMIRDNFRDIAPYKSTSPALRACLVSYLILPWFTRLLYVSLDTSLPSRFAIRNLRILPIR